jgi:7-hydroxymethyl chlorophyll a reductase
MQVDAVLCVASEEDDALTPKPLLARSVEQVLSSKGVKPTLSPTLHLLPLLEDPSIRRVLACGVGCQVQALREVEAFLGLEKLYVLGTNCVDNAPARAALSKFLHVASARPASVASYEFMPDYTVHLNHRGGGLEVTPYFCLPAHELKDVIAPSCYACFDYSNALAGPAPIQRICLRHVSAWGCAGLCSSGVSV